MGKILKVEKPFFVMEPGDTMELSADGNYVSMFASEYNFSDDMDIDATSRYQSVYEISPKIAESLIREGFLSEVKSKDDAFVNVFDEIEKMIKSYGDELANIDKEFKDQPACLKVEKETVLTNMIKVLGHLNSLKK